MKFSTATIALAIIGSTNAFSSSPFGRPRTTISTRVAETERLQSFVAGRRQSQVSLFSKDGVTSAEVSKEDIQGLFSLWNDALATGNSKIVASRYAKDAVLLPTVSDTPRTDFDSIVDYFDLFLQRKPRGEILDSHVKIGDGWASDVGVYQFFMGDNGTKVKGRYSFFYTLEDGEWKIAHHHSSVMPEGITVGQDITEKEVQNLFHLWNDALATGDSTTVAERYSKNSVLLPTVSDIPRTDFEGKVDYFDNFLQLQPQGVIEESNVVIGANWAQDAGIYEFTLGKDGSKVRARYSFIYVFEDGQWKISHHHSSAMPESGKSSGPKLSEDEARGLFNLWNDALATLDADTVAKRYSKQAILLPTVSDTPRTDYDTIKDYFENFLQNMPQGVITEGQVTVGEGWAKDAGVYEFTMGTDGSKVKARYSFVYVYEDGEWKISHHHSSAMPEALLAAADKVKKLEEVLAL